MKGPDTMSKSKRTQQRYRKVNKNQSSLTDLGFTAMPALPTDNIEAVLPSISSLAQTPSRILPDPNIIDLTMDTEPIAGLAQPASRARSASVLSDPSTDGDGNNPNLRDVPEEEESEGEDEGRDFDEECESGLDETVQGMKQAVHDWSDIRKDIKAHLKKNQKSLTLSEINQYLIISNFTTLRIKGQKRTQASLEIARQWHEGEGNWFACRVRALARHYQTFENLPAENRGGKSNARSLLHDESVEKQTRDWLTSQPTGKVTPQRLREALNSTILPGLGIILKCPLSMRTARRWLIKPGWRRTVVRKGVYMDGHEREDVVKYRQNIFLPAMREFEARMAMFEGPELKRVDPELKDGEKEIFMYFHDECCFHGNDEAHQLW